MDKVNKDVKFTFNYQGKDYGFKVEGKVCHLDPESGREVIEVVLPQDKTEKLLNSLFEVIERQRKIK